MRNQQVAAHMALLMRSGLEPRLLQEMVKNQESMQGELDKLAVQDCQGNASFCHCSASWLLELGNEEPVPGERQHIFGAHAAGQTLVQCM